MVDVLHGTGMFSLEHDRGHKYETCCNYSTGPKAVIISRSEFIYNKFEKFYSQAESALQIDINHIYIINQIMNIFLHCIY